MRRLIRLWLLVLGFAAIPAKANFHLFSMSELYSNADGSVQYLVLTALTGGQQFLAGHTLVATGASTTRTYNFTTNLPGDTSGKRFLVATQGFAALGIVTPDYVVPNNFFPLQTGNINFGESSDVWNYVGLPSDGVNALVRTGGSQQNSPVNFAGVRGTIPAQQQADFNVQALWWRSPGGSESGWGINITQQEQTLFMTWFTYDTDGSGMWLVMSNGARTGPNTYSGALFRTTGPAFNANPFNPSQVAVTQVGSGTFTFTAADRGTFTYTVNGVTQSKPIERQVYATPVSTCTVGGQAGAALNVQDLWWRSPAGSESGWGVNITQQGNILFATWFTYAADGRGQWLVMSEGRETAPNTYSGTLFRTRGPSFAADPWSPTQVSVTPVGTGTFTFSDPINGTFTYTLDGVTQTKPITRQVYATPTSVCR